MTNHEGKESALRPEGSYETRGSIPVREVVISGECRVSTVGPNASVRRALDRMLEENVGALIVLDGEQVAGIVSERDCARKVLAKGMNPLDTPVESVMSRSICSVSANKSVKECIELMLRRGIRHLPVFFGRHLVGCVSLRDLVGFLILPKARPAVEESGSANLDTLRHPR